MASIAHRTLLINTNNVGSTTKSILGTLLSYCHNGKDECYPSIGDMIKLTKYARRTIQIHLRILERLEIIAITKGTNRKSNTYKVLGLYSEQMHCACGAPRSNSSEEVLKTIYDAHRSQNQKTKAKNQPGKSQKPSAPQRVAESEPVEHQRVEKDEIQPVEPQRVAETQSQTVAPQRVFESQSQPITSSSAGKKESQKPIAQPVGKIRFEGELTLELAVKIYTLYGKAGFIQKSTASLLEFLSVCAAVMRLKRKNKCRNIYAYLTFIYKNRKTWAIIKDEDEDKARAIMRHIREKNLVDL